MEDNNCLEGESRATNSKPRPRGTVHYDRGHFAALLPASYRSPRLGMACPIMTDSKEDFVAHISSEATRDEESNSGKSSLSFSMIEAIFYKRLHFPELYFFF